MKSNLPVVLHIPHARIKIPSDIRKTLILSDADLKKELILKTDAYTDEIFNVAKVQRIIFPVSRLVIDPERFIDDSKEIMAAKGMGVIYTRTSHGQILRDSPNNEDRAALIDKYYKPHHEELHTHVAGCLENFSHCLIIDCHSFPSKVLPYELDQSEDRPDICIGTDSFHTPQWLTEKVSTEFENAGYSIKINKPFAGTLVPMTYYRQNSSVNSIMIEVNRKLYLDEDTGLKNYRFDSVRQNIASILENMISIFSNNAPKQ